MLMLTLRVDVKQEKPSDVADKRYENFIIILSSQKFHWIIFISPQAKRCLYYQSITE